jgi:1-acyl-sn-glycerol-3-phosphate acyltransferase
LLITDAQTKTSTKEHNIELGFIRNLLTPDELRSDAVRLIRPSLSGQDIAYLQYTPGVTGEPKGVTITHANLLANIQTIGEWGRLSSQDVLVSWLPLYHNMGLIGTWLTSLFYAVLLVNMPPLFFLISPAQWLWAMHHFRATLAVAPNFAYDICVQQVNRENLQGLDLSPLKIAINSSEFVLAETIEKFTARFGEFGFHSYAMAPMFSLAESTFVLTLPPVGRAVRVDRIERDAFAYTGYARPTGDSNRALQFVSCGSPLAGHEIRVVDALGSELPERHQGRLEFRGPSAAVGYYRNPQQSRYLHHGEWLDSGDLAYIANGELFVTGRAKELIHHRGRNIHPFELEQAISRLPGVIKGSVALFGHRSSHPRKDRLIVLAGTREEDTANLKAMRTGIEEATAALIGVVPDDIVLTLPDTIPRTARGQIRRIACRELYENKLIDKALQPARRRKSNRYLRGNFGYFRQWVQVISSRLYGVYFWGTAIPLIAITWCFLTLCPIGSWRWRFARRAAKTLFHLTGVSILVEGRENFPPKHQPCIYVCNHSSYLDGFILMQVLPARFSFVAKAGLARQFFSRTFLGRLDTIFVDRFDKEKGIEDATNILHQAFDGKSFLIFPEGSFTRRAGLLPFHLGAFVTACDAGLPIVPITLHGTRSLLRDESLLPRHVDVSVMIDKPIDPNEFLRMKKQSDRLSAILALRDTVRERMLKRVGEPDLAEEKFPV